MPRRLSFALSILAAVLVAATAALAGTHEDFLEGQSAIRAGQLDKAVVAYTRVIDAAQSGTAVDRKDLASAYNMRGMCHDAKNESELALADYTKAIENDPKMAEAYGNRAMLYKKLGETDKAKADAAAARRIDYKVKVPTFQ